MNWSKIWIFSLIGSMIFGLIGSILMMIFLHCNGSCYWTNDLVKSLMLPMSTIFLFWFVGNLPFAGIVYLLEKRGVKNEDIKA